MNETSDAPSRAFQFSGSWKEFAPIALTNLLLTIVTLGIYSFWAKARERRYLWSSTQFIDDRLEWTGTGRELFLGYVIVGLALFVPLVFINFGVQALAMNGAGGLAVILSLLAYLLILGLMGVATFRGLRYRLSRTYWRGIRGGSDDNGVAYGVNYVWRTILGALAFGLMVPWALTSLWNKRWNLMSFGPFVFEARADSAPLMKRYLLFYLAPIVMVVALVAIAVLQVGGQNAGAPESVETITLGVWLGIFIWYVLLGIIAIAFYAAYFREAVGKLSLGDLSFEFDARTMDWIKLILGHAALVICTLGIGFVFIGYRNWAFFARHLNAYGTIDVDALTQSTTRAPGQGEGLLQAFDMGGI